MRPKWLHLYLCKAPLNVFIMKRALYKSGIIIIIIINEFLILVMPFYKVWR